jgi:hypothetical protein
MYRAILLVDQEFSVWFPQFMRGSSCVRYKSTWFCLLFLTFWFPFHRSVKRIEVRQSGTSAISQWKGFVHRARTTKWTISERFFTLTNKNIRISVLNLLIANSVQVRVIYVQIVLT